MSKLKYILALLVLSLFLVPNTSVSAQGAPDSGYEYETYSNDDYDWETFDSQMDSVIQQQQEMVEDYNDAQELSDEALGASLFLLTGIWALFSTVIGLAVYVFSSLALMKIGQKLGYENSWFAWVPVLNAVMLFQLGNQNPWLLLLVIIPGLGALIIGIMAVIAMMNISEKRGYDKMLGLLTLVPVGNLVLLGILAWKDKETQVVAPATPVTPVATM